MNTLINMDDIRQERLSEDPILSLKYLNKIHETRNLSHASRNPWSLRSWKGKHLTLPEVKLLVENPRVG